jgi:hypothetical protein
VEFIFPSAASRDVESFFMGTAVPAQSLFESYEGFKALLNHLAEVERMGEEQR